jgi:hypothetical protein
MNQHADKADTSAAGGSDVRGVAILFGLSLAWLTATLFSAHGSISASVAEPTVALGATAFALPNVIAAVLLASAAAGRLAAGTAPRATRLPAAWRANDPKGRAALGLISAALVGLSCAGLVVAFYGGNASVGRLAATIFAAALIGGAATALPRRVLFAGLCGTLGVFLLGLVFSIMQPRLVDLFGGAASPASAVNASWTLAYVQAAVGGAVAGLLAFSILRRGGARAWPWYLLAGALPGMLLLVTELLTRTGGGALLGLVRGLSEGDALAIDLNNFARLRNAMLVIFVGGLAAMIAVGRTLRVSGAEPAEDDQADEPTTRTAS